MKNIRHWWLQKFIDNNLTRYEDGARFEEFAPTIVNRGYEWVKVVSADDVQRAIGMGLTRYSDVMAENVKLRAALEKIAECAPLEIETMAREALG